MYDSARKATDEYVATLDWSVAMLGVCDKLQAYQTGQAPMGVWRGLQMASQDLGLNGQLEKKQK